MGGRTNRRAPALSTRCLAAPRRSHDCSANPVVRSCIRQPNSPHEPDKIIEGITVGATVKLKVRAVNETGEGPFGEEVEVVVA